MFMRSNLNHSIDMTTASNWNQVQRTVTRLKLDPRNPRIPDSETEFSQRDLIRELLEHDRVEKLAKDIAEHGYFIVESLIAVEDEDGKLVVVEGNRRLAALKLLLNPEMAPTEKAIKSFRKISASVDKDSIKKINVVVAPSRQSALIYIRNKHTQLGFEKWSPVMQAKFYHDTIEEEAFTVRQAAKFFNMAPGDVMKNVQFYKMYEIAKALDLADDIRELVENVRDFPMTNVERFYLNPKIAKSLGIEFNEEGELRGSIDPNEFKKGYRRIVTDVATKKVDSRTHNKASNFEQYVSELGDDKPNLRKKGTFTAQSILNPQQKAKPEPVQPKAKPKPNAKRGSAKLFSASLKCYLENRRTNQVFDELYRLKVAENPTCSVVLIRILLEDCVSNYLDKTCKMDELLEKHKKKGKKNDWYPTLRQMLNQLIEDEDFKLHPLALKTVKRLVNGQDQIMSLDTLDTLVHNKFEIATEPKVRDMWGRLEELFKLLLVEPDSEMTSSR